MGAKSRTAAEPPGAPSFRSPRFQEPPVSGAEDAEDVLLLHDEILLAVELDLATGVLAEEDAIPRLDVERGLLAVLGDLAFADRDDLALLGLLLGAVRDDDAAAPRGFLLDPLEQDTVVERVQDHLLCLSHGAPPVPGVCERGWWG